MCVDELPGVKLDSLTNYEDWRVNATAKVVELIPMSNSDWPPQKGIISDDTVTRKKRIAFVLAEIPQVGKLERGQTYRFKNVRVNIYRRSNCQFTPEEQLFVDRFSEVKAERGGTTASDNPGTDQKESKSESRPDPTSSGKEVRTDKYGERLAGKNPHNDPSRIKNAGLHQGGG